MQGIWIQTEKRRERPMTKKGVITSIRKNPDKVFLEATSIHPGLEHDGPVSTAPPGTYNFVGPDPYTNRKFYGTIHIKKDGTTTCR